MKHSFLYLSISLFLIALHVKGQSPVYFPDGLIVGPVGVTLPVSPAPYKMAVAGGIITEKVRVATNGTTFWADFVFDKNYKLRTLTELEYFIKKYKHLPEMPTTSQVNKEGIDLAHTTALLLQKVEELTLYSIEQNKKIENLERKIKLLSKKNK